MSLDFFDVTRNTTKYIRNANGLLEQVPANVPAFEFNADGSYKGCLIEPANTEKILYSKAFDNAYWDKSRTTVTNGYPDPKGDNEAFLLAETTEDNIHVIRIDVNQRPSIGSGETWTQSWFVKKGTGANAPDIVQITHGTATHGTGVWANFNLVTGEFTRIENASVEVKRFSDGWWRIGITAASSSSGDVNALLVFCQNNPNADRALEYAGQTDADVFIYGANLKQSPVMESYTETTGSEVTRNADVIAITDAADLIGQSEGTLFVSFVPRNFEPDARAAYLNLNEADNINANRYSLQRTSEGGELIRINRRAAGQQVFEFGGIEFNKVNKLAVCYKDDRQIIFFNGQKVDDSDSLDLPTGLSVVDIGMVSGNGPRRWANDHIRSVALWKRALTEAEAIALTTL